MVRGHEGEGVPQPRSEVVEPRSPPILSGPITEHTQVGQGHLLQHRTLSESILWSRMPLVPPLMRSPSGPPHRDGLPGRLRLADGVRRAVAPAVPERGDGVAPFHYLPVANEPSPLPAVRVPVGRKRLDAQTQGPRRPLGDPVHAAGIAGHHRRATVPLRGGGASKLIETRALDLPSPRRGGAARRRSGREASPQPAYPARSCAPRRPSPPPAIREAEPPKVG